MDAGYFLQAYKAKGERLVGQPTERHGFVDEALSAGARLARWRAGVVVFRQAVDERGIQCGPPSVLAVHGRVPDGWLPAKRGAA